MKALVPTAPGCRPGALQQVWSIRGDMSELEALFRVALAALLGGVIGFEREVHDKSAGLRTHTLVALGAAMFTVIAIRIVELPAFSGSNLRLDPTRVLEGVIGGIGFLGGAIVFRRADQARGLTTAAGIWTVTGVGIASALGYFVLAFGVTVLILIVLYGLKLVERVMGTR
jgi:putative Mg2+ transporter-C (MgtC) family protein